MTNKKLHILIIDDDEMIQKLFGAKLSKEGFEPLYAHNAENGREMARRLNPDLILLDIRMPGIDGYDMAQRLKEEQETKDIPLALLTNEDLATEAQKWMKEIGVLEYFHKSMDLDKFIKKVREITQKKI